jgi:hypothetical protein
MTIAWLARPKRFELLTPRFVESCSDITDAHASQPKSCEFLLFDVDFRALFAIVRLG